MYFIAAFGALMMLLSIVMIVKPSYWAVGIVSFSKQTFFHWFEVSSRMVCGGLFVYFSQATKQPELVNVIGYILISVGIGLVVVGEKRHKVFAVWSAKTLRPIFSVAGVFSLIFGAYLVYISVL